MKNSRRPRQPTSRRQLQACPGHIERQAYDLQAAWLREQGVAEPFELIGISEFTMMMMMTACPSADG
jgi:hypothetical protein